MNLAHEIERRHNIIQGEYKVSGDAQTVITTLLGSCVAACMHDPAARVGGMNHFLLPGDSDASRLSEAERYGVHLMEILVNGMLKQGARRERIQAKLFGGARTIRNLSDVGGANARFAKEFLKREGIAVVGGSLGGIQGRRLQFWPASGRARQILMSADEPVIVQTEVPPSALAKLGEVELF